MTTYATPKTYAWLYSVSLTQQYKTQLLFWLKWDTPKGLYELVLKELKMEDPFGNRNGHSDSAAEKGKTSGRDDEHGKGSEGGGVSLLRDAGGAGFIEEGDAQNWSEGDDEERGRRLEGLEDG